MTKQEVDTAAITAALKWLVGAVAVSVPDPLLVGIIRDHPDCGLAAVAINFAHDYAKEVRVGDPRYPDWTAAAVRWLEATPDHGLLVSAVSAADFLRGFPDSVHATALAQHIVGVGGQHFNQARGGA